MQPAAAPADGADAAAAAEEAGGGLLIQRTCLTPNCGTLVNARSAGGEGRRSYCDACFAKFASPDDANDAANSARRAREKLKREERVERYKQHPEEMRRKIADMVSCSRMRHFCAARRWFMRPQMVHAALVTVQPSQVDLFTEAGATATFAITYEKQGQSVTYVKHSNDQDKPGVLHTVIGGLLSMVKKVSTLGSPRTPRRDCSLHAASAHCACPYGADT